MLRIAARCPSMVYDKVMLGILNHWRALHMQKNKDNTWENIENNI